MEKNSLTSLQVTALKTAHRQEKYRKHADRIKVILLLNMGLSYEEISNILLINDSTVRKYEKCYLEKGLEGLLEGHYYGR
jgi:transposase